MTVVLGGTSFSIGHILVICVAVGAGLATIATFLYNLKRNREAERPLITATCGRNPTSDLVLNLKIVRLERHDLIVHKIRGHRITFSPGRYDNSGRWVVGEFFKELSLDWTVTSEVSTIPRSLPCPVFSGFDSRDIFVAVPDTKSKMIEIKVLVSKTSRRSRERWMSIKAKITH